MTSDLKSAIEQIIIGIDVIINEVELLTEAARARDNRVSIDEQTELTVFAKDRVVSIGNVHRRHARSMVIGHAGTRQRSRSGAVSGRQRVAVRTGRFVW